MATHHEARRVEQIARDVDNLALHLKREVKRLEEFATALRDVKDDGKPLDSSEKFNIRNNTRRVAFESMRTGGHVTSVETMLYSLDRFVEDDD